MSLEAGISQIVTFQLYRHFIAEQPFPTTFIPPLFFMRHFLSRRPLDPRKLRPQKGPIAYQKKNPSFAWIFAVTILRPEDLAVMTGFNSQEIQEFSVWICSEFFKRTSNLLEKAKKEKLDRSNEDWATLNEHLTTLCLLTMNHLTQARLQDQLTKAICRLVENACKDSMPDNGRISAAKLTFEDHMMKEGTVEYITRHGVKEAFEHVLKAFELVLESRSCQQYLCQYEIAINQEGWDHLQRYAQHWLEKLVEGPSRYTEVMIKTFRLNTLCRLASRKGFKDCGPLPPEVDQQRLESVVTEVHSLLSHVQQPVPIKFVVDELTSISNQIVSPIQASDKSEGWRLVGIYKMLDWLEQKIARMQAQKSPSEHKMVKVMAPHDIPDSALGSGKCDCPRNFSYRVGEEA